MNLTVIGGGPGGLYASELIKKEFPDWEVSVYERNRRGNTYGWGVVFSDATLGTLKEADAPSHKAITDAFASWNDIDTYVEGQWYRCSGHGFASILRADLLRVLQDRCRDVGVELHHEHRVDEPEAYREAADVLVGADGLRSTVRDRYHGRFQPTIQSGETKFIWLGTEKVFDAFTFIFRENAHGLWRVHAYPGTKSTFIVECTESTWENADMDKRDEADALAYFEDLFTDHLDGHGLESKLYTWRRFPEVSCDSWSTEDIVLLGDAAHTVHFTVGSGTKLAMEDAIALTGAFREHGDDLGAVFDAFETARRPQVATLQDMGRRSQRFFENVERYIEQEPRQFIFNLLTRSGRVSYDELRVRDPTFVDSYDRWFDRFEGASDGTPTVATPPLFKPLRLGDITLPNRVVSTCRPRETSSDGVPGRATLETYVDDATSGVGMVLTQPVAVTENGRISRDNPGLYADAQRDAWLPAVERIHAETETAAGLHLAHAGRRKEGRFHTDRPPSSSADLLERLAPSAIPYSAEHPVPTAMDASDLQAIRRAFVAATERADAAGFDYLQLHAGDGYLLGQFLSPLANVRTDEYGGRTDARLRYPLEVVDAVRDVWPDHKPLGVTMQAKDCHADGIGLTEAESFALALDECGCDLLAPVIGGTLPPERQQAVEVQLVDACDRIRNETGVPTLSTAQPTSFDAINTQVGAGRTDLCTFSPPGLE
ncbi:bifunctional salicylyl-CoA 5-hydroxylase/oxidoreductase [Halobacteriales archaeon QS_1_69_70]|nr:MAG: bifunctional salicylyl-CoA 5-hydroxylase/oxidoreductase [Halobacteriales archaeon QS_1_69_70]